MSVCLMLHGLGPPPPGTPQAEIPYWLPARQFEAIVALARSADAFITIDDGNASDAEIALPMLMRAGMKAAFFIPSDRIGKSGYLSGDGIRLLHRAGMSIGSHGRAHVRWKDIPDSAIVDDVTRSNHALAAITGECVTSVAVPFGACDRRVLRVLRSLGVRRVYTSFRGPDCGSKWLVRRDCITADMSQTGIERLIMPAPPYWKVALSLLRTWRHAGMSAFLGA